MTEQVRPTSMDQALDSSASDSKISSPFSDGDSAGVFCQVVANKALNKALLRMPLRRKVQVSGQPGVPNVKAVNHPAKVFKYCGFINQARVLVIR